MNSFVQLGIKILYSGILLSAVYLFGNEIYRVWFDRTLVLSPFSYLKDGVELRESGQSFTQRFSHDLQRLQNLYTGSNYEIGELSIPSTDQLGRGRQLDIPITRPDVLPEIEIKAYGIQVTDLLRRISRTIRRPHEIAGNVSEREGRFDVYAEVRYTKFSNGTTTHWHLPGRAGMDELSHDLACRVLMEIAAEQAPKLFGRTGSEEPVSVGEFCGFLRGLESYKRYRELLAGVEITERADTELKRVKTIVDQLLSRNVRLPFTHKLAGYVLNDAGEPANALEQIDTYIDMLSKSGHTDESALIFREELVAETRQNLPDINSTLTQSRIRPLRPGIDVGSELSRGGTLTCFVKDDRGLRYAITALHSVDDIGSPVFQPSLLNGGTNSDQIGFVSQVGSGTEYPAQAGAALIELVENIEAENRVLEIGNIRSPIDALIEPGVEILIITKDELINTEIRTIELQTRIYTPNGQPTMFRNLISIPRVTEPGISGAPVVTKNTNQLIGFVFAGSQSETLVMPIAPMLDALQLSWLDTQLENEPSN